MNPVTSDAVRRGEPSTRSDAAHVARAAPESPRIVVPPARPAPVRARILRGALEALVPRLRDRMNVVLPDGTTRHSRAGGTGAPTVWIHDDALFHRLATTGKIGLGESYMAGEWDSDDLACALTVVGRYFARVPPALNRAVRSVAPLVRDDRANTIAGASRNVARHYDLSNDLFATFLDETLAYSCAIFDTTDPAAAADDATLAAAQRRKYDVLCDDLRLRADHHLLEIGSGWGGMAVHAARTRGCRVTTITLSAEQHAFVSRRIGEEELGALVDVQLRDYREVSGTYDRVVSIEMLEAVGEPFWGAYFAAVARLLAPGGLAAVQTITMPHDRWLAARGGYGWIHKYVFPGGEIPSLEALTRPVAGAGLAVMKTRDIGRHYVPTLRGWRERFLAHHDEIRALGFDAVFERMWEFYLAYCEAGFRSGILGDHQVVLGTSPR